MIRIRKATSVDAGPLAELRWEFRAGRQPPVLPHDVFVRRCANWMRHELSGGRWHAWAAMKDADLVGGVWLQTIEKIPNPVAEPERHAYLSNLFVKPDDRGGVGTRLVEAALDWSRSNGIDRVVLWPVRRSISLYLRQGFTQAGEVMELKV